jgi:DNA-binding response OmpR family regulator
MAQTKRCPQILIVDDEVDSATTFARLVEALGCAAVAITDPRIAVETADAIKAELVFLDIRMPVVSGLDIARELRKKHGWQRLRIVAVTGLGSEEHRVASRSAGFDAHVTKTVDLHLLESVMHTLFPETRWLTKPT